MARGLAPSSLPSTAHSHATRPQLHLMLDEDDLLEDDDDVIELDAAEAIAIDDDDVLDAGLVPCEWLEWPTQVDGHRDETIVDASDAGARRYPPGLGKRALASLISQLTAELCDA